MDQELLPEDFTLQEKYKTESLDENLELGGEADFSLLLDLR